MSSPHIRLANAFLSIRPPYGRFLAPFWPFATSKKGSSRRLDDGDLGDPQAPLNLMRGNSMMFGAMTCYDVPKKNVRT